MDIESLATEAHKALCVQGVSDLGHGMEAVPGFFVLYNARTGQSRDVLYHEESGYVFKTTDYGFGFDDAESNSRKNLGLVELDGVTYRMRFPEWHLVVVDGEEIEVQEYVNGEDHKCLSDENVFQNAWCEHAYAIARASGLGDTHSGNWKIVGDEVIIFDC